MDSNNFLATPFHLISDPFFNIEVICFTSSAKFGINLLTKFILPRKDWMSFFDLGIDKVCITFTLSRSIQTPVAETICPNNLPSSNANCDFLGFTEIPNLLNFKNTFFKCCTWS